MSAIKNFIESFTLSVLGNRFSKKLQVVAAIEVLPASGHEYEISYVVFDSKDAFLKLRRMR